MDFHICVDSKQKNSLRCGCQKTATTAIIVDDFHRLINANLIEKIAAGIRWCSLDLVSTCSCANWWCHFVCHPSSRRRIAIDETNREKTRNIHIIIIALLLQVELSFFSATATGLLMTHKSRNLNMFIQNGIRAEAANFFCWIHSVENITNSNRTAIKSSWIN